MKKEGKIPKGAITPLLLAAALCAVGFALQAFLRPGPSAGPSGSGAARSNAEAAQYLKSMPWDKKTHPDLKPLAKVKNLRYALEFFDMYPPGQIARLPAEQSTLQDAYAGYSGIAGNLISIDTSVVQVYDVPEDIAGGQSALVSLGDPGAGVTASLLVAGSPPEGLKAGDGISFICLPLYCYAPASGEGGLLLVTVPELIKKS
jgi:hypothetical protein